ncbi:MAG: aldo/keto reductase [Oceanospirillaceae bacterium]|nr:aldo/keto reductase [Oceanospirillaceae bacterium]
MQRIALSKDLELSQIIYGMWRLGDVSDTSPYAVQAKIEACLEQGITSIDQADIYGGYAAEALLGKSFAAASHLIDKVEIITKCDIVAPVGRHENARVKHYDTSAAHINYSVECSLTHMNIEHIDCLLVHRPDPLMDHEETGRALDNLVRSGKVGSIGASNFKPHDWSLLQSAMSSKLVTNQIELSVVETSAFTNGDIAFLQENKISPMAWSPLGGGSLFSAKDDKSKAILSCLTHIANEQNTTADAVAIAWLLKHPCNILPVMGTNNLERIKSLSSALKVSLDRQAWFEIYTASLGHEVA